MMTRLKTSATALGVLTVLAASASGMTILVDYDDGIAGNGIHDTAVRNGGFESPFSTVDGVTFTDTDNWQNLQGGQDAIARRTNLQDTGDYTTVNQDSPTLQFGLDTEHTISSGDIFFLEFRARNAFNATAASTITAEIYYTTDDTIGGSATVVGTVTADNMSTTFAAFNDTFAPIAGGDAAVGKNLFLRFEQSAGPGFTRTDGWYLTVVPEPSSLALLSFGGLFVARRRKP